MFTLKIETENAAFEETPAIEVARILHKVIRDLLDGDKEGHVNDYYGNTVGSFTLAED